MPAAAACIALAFLLTACARPSVQLAPHAPAPSVAVPASAAARPSSPPAPAHQSQSLTTVRLQSLDMLDPSSGWALGAKGTVLHTTDGGLHWRDVTPPLADAQGRVFLLQATAPATAFAVQPPPETDNATTAWLYATVDGGTTWTRIALPDPLPAGAPVSLDFVGQDGWLMLRSNSAMFAQEVMIYHTADGGAHWTLVEQTSWSTHGGGALPPGGDKTGLVFRSAAAGWATGYSPAQGHPWLYATQDGGRHWASQALTVPPQLAADETTVLPPTFLGPSAGLLPVIFGYGQSQVLCLYRTADGGASWRPGALEPIPVAGPNPAVAMAPSGDTWVANGQHLNVTRDAGATWTALAPLTNVAGLDFVNPSDGWALVAAEAGGPPSLMATHDGGRTWSALPAAIAR